MNLILSLAPGIPSYGAAKPDPAQLPAVHYPDANARMPQLLADRAKEQTLAASKATAFHDFQFSNGLATTRIQFHQRSVDDAGRHWKPVHYDHGTAVAAADVDGDSHIDLYFVNQLGPNQLWRSLGNGRFEDITAQAGVAITGRVHVAASFADIDNDRDPDLFVTTVNRGNVLFENLGAGRFRDITQAAGLDYSGHSSGAVFFDYDRDGLLDLFLVNVGVYTTPSQGPDGVFPAITKAFHGHLYPERSERSILYRNLSQRQFQNVSQTTGLLHSQWSGDATFTDLNQDQWPDLYVVTMQGDDRYYENNGGKQFVDQTARYFPKTPWGAMGIKCFDFNLDGLLDVFVTDMHSDMTDTQNQLGRTRLDSRFEKEKSEAYCTTFWTDAFLQGASNNLFGNAFFLNQGQGQFAEVSQKIGAETYWPWGLSVGDLNADGYEDAFITAGMGYPFRYGINSLLLNDHGTRFFDAEFLVGIEPRAGNQYDRDLFVFDCSGADTNHPLCAGRSGPLRVYGSRSSRSSVLLDLDDDGDLDIVTNEMNDEPLVLVSNLSSRRKLHFLKVKLEGTRSNFDGLGATVRVQAGGKTFLRYHDAKSGYLAQSLLSLYFGLGDVARAERVEVLWPSGVRQTITNNIPANSLLVLREPASSTPN